MFFKLNYRRYLKCFFCSFGLIVLVPHPALAKNIETDSANFFSIDRSEFTLVQNSDREVDIFVPEDRPREVDGTFDPDLRNNIPGTLTKDRCKSLRLILDSQTYSNINAAAENEPIPATFSEDTRFINSAFLLAKPRLGENICFKALLGGTFGRYAETGDFNNYNLLNLGLAIERELARDTYLEFGWSQDLFYQDGKNTAFDNSAVLSLFRRNELKQNQLWLDLYNQFQITFSDVPINFIDQSRISNIARADLFYKFTPRLFGGLNYQLNYATFTIDPSNCEDRLNQQLGTELIYNFTSDGSARVSTSAGYIFGSTCNFIQNRSVDVDNFVLGIRFILDLSLFD